MKSGSESVQEKRKKLIAGVLGGFAALLVGYQLYDNFGPSTPNPAATQAAMTTPVVKTVGPGAAGQPAQKLTTSAQLDPSLHPEAMLVTEALVYTGSGRNIFSGVAEAPPTPPVPEAKSPPARPCPPNCPPPPPPPVPCPPNCPPPPAINLKFFGTATAQNGTRRAFLLNGDDVFVASVGDVVERRYRVVSIAANSILVEDIPNTNKQTLPLVPQ